MKIYKVLDISTGSYIDCETEENAWEKITDLALEKWFEYTQGYPYSIVEIGEDGSETWRNPEGEKIKSPDELKEEMESFLKSNITKSNPTPIETLP